LSTKYVMLRIRTSTTTGFHQVQLIPFGSWNSGTDVGTNQAGTPIVNNSASQYGFDCDFMYNIFNMNYTAPHTMIANNTSGLLYVAFDPSAAYIMMWPYFISAGAVYNGSGRAQVLMYGEYQEDFTAYTNVPPVYVTTLQRLSFYGGILPTYGANGDLSAPAYQGANNTNIGTLSSGPWQTSFGSTYIAHLYHPGPLWLSPVAPGSTTGYSGVANTIRTGPQASAFQRMLLGQLGEYGFTSFQGSQGHTSHTLVNGQYYYEVAYLQHGTFTKNSFGNGGYHYNEANAAVMHGQTALNSTNLKGIEPILGGGCTNIYNMPSGSMNTAYAANPFPLAWMGGRTRGLKFVGSPTTQGAWSTLDTVNMNVDTNGFFVKTGGTSTSFALVGFAPFRTTPDASYDPNCFFAIPS